MTSEAHREKTGLEQATRLFYDLSNPNSKSGHQATCFPLDGISAHPLSDCSDFDTSQCQTSVPNEWTCDLTFYGDRAYCDCGCGVPDPDCPDAMATSCQVCDIPGSCSEGQGICSTVITPDDNSTCVVARCGDSLVTFPEVCDGANLNGENCTSIGPYDGGVLACNDACDAFDTAACTGGPPPEWMCGPFFYGNFDGCDCGCGALDPDCADESVGACDFCNNNGSCDSSGMDCPGSIRSSENWLCQ